MMVISSCGAMSRRAYREEEKVGSDHFTAALGLQLVQGSAKEWRSGLNVPVIASANFEEGRAIFSRSGVDGIFLLLATFRGHR